MENALLNNVLQKNLPTDNVFMKRLLAALFVLLFAACASARAQVVPSGTGSEYQLSVGVLGSVLQPDIFCNGGGASEACYVGTSPNRVYGVGSYVDLRLSRWIQPEFEARWSRADIDGESNAEDTYLGGLRVPIHIFHKMHATPYGKFLLGWGRGADFLDSTRPTTLAIAYGGGLDLRVTRRITLRAFDFEYQQWRTRYPPTTVATGSGVLFPYEGSVGLSYRIF
jgi:opacity protein-like surface antigen